MKKIWHRGLPFSPEVAPYLRRMALVDEHREELLRLQGVWDSLALLGQMSGTATDIGQTRTAFQNLTTTLLDSLARRLRDNALARMNGRARVAIDILVRNLFERTADVGFLASDGPLCAHAALDPTAPDHATRRAAVQARLAAYTAKYSVYDDVIVLSPRGEVLARCDDSQPLTNCDEPWVAAALASDAPYVERFGPTALLGGRQGLIYARALHAPSGVVGLLCLSFKLADEMSAIFHQLLAGQDVHAVICLLDAEHRVLQSSDAWQVPPGAQLSIHGERLLFAGRDYLCATATASGYEGYMGPPGWTACVMTPLEWAFDGEADAAANEDLRRLGEAIDTAQLFDAELQGIPLEARRIQRNLSRTLWNGKLRSHGQGDGERGASFATTLLNEVQRTGAQLRQVFEQAIAKLQGAALAAVFDGAVFQARLAVDIMDRNLYERANDCRWWALDVRLQRALAAQTTLDAPAAAAEAQQVLQQINALYTVYSLLLVYDLQGRVVAVSDTAQAHHVGRSLQAPWVAAALGLRDPERHVVSRHEASPLYGAADGDAGERPTYVYACAVAHEGQIVGGIAIVFDGEPQFGAMLKASLPDEAGDSAVRSAGLFVARDGRVVSSTDGRWTPGLPGPISPAVLAALHAGQTARQELQIDGRVYAAGIAMSQGYREYKRGQAASGEDVAALLLVPLGQRRDGPQDGAEAGFVPPPAQAGGERLDIAAFSVAGEWLGLPAGLLVEALEQPRLTALPNAPRALVGMLQHDNRMVPVLDLSLALYGRAAAASDAPVLICREAGRTLALRVDELGAVFSIAAGQALAGPGQRARLVRGGEGSSSSMLTLLSAADLWAHLGVDAEPAQSALPAQ
ncbi:chemotaxis protein CheW [Roseateles cellulosilyticus]|uniref:Chemotaxis protein CheW n=1 Tax=Pelomonas cellulosilytica TaxID=2906762 RepID=A0ABS8XNC8_9BURK|nr:chemotaxis protein CheW [Pelomonas sp. P8]MCE4553147.1 chemotaxis protein CheW [Pelomonas sp. P8]